jgi:hypothetical protein
MSVHYLLTESHLPINLYTYLIIMNSYFILFSPKKFLIHHLPYISSKTRYAIIAIMAVLRVFKRNSTFMDVTDLVEEISSLGLIDALQKYHNKPLQKEAKSIVAGPSFLQFLNKLFRIQITTGDIIQFESGNNSKYYMLSTTGTWDEIIKLQ